MYPSCISHALEVLKCRIDEYDPTGHPPDLKIAIQILHLDFRFFKMFFWALAYQGGYSSRDGWHFALSSMDREFSKTTEEFIMQVGDKSDGDGDVLEPMISHLRNKVQQYKEKAKEICLAILRGAFTCKPFQSEESFLKYVKDTAFLIFLILDNLKALPSNRNLIDSMKQQMTCIESRVKMFGRLACMAQGSPTTALRLSKLISYAQTWVSQASCLICLYWIDDMNESMAPEMGSMLSNLMHKDLPPNLEVISVYTSMFRCMGSQEFHSDEVNCQLYIDYLLKRLIIRTEDGVDTDILHERLMFFLFFCLDQVHADQVSEEIRLLLGKTFTIFRVLRSLTCNTEIKLSAGCLDRIEGAKVQVREVYVVSPLSSEFSSPKTNAIGFLTAFLAKLEKMLEAGRVDFSPCTRGQVEKVKEELAELERVLKVELHPDNEPEEVKNVWSNIANVVYFAAYVTHLCASTLVWYGSICFPNLIEDIKLVKSQWMKMIDGCQMHSHRGLRAEQMDTSSNYALPLQATALNNEGAFIGFNLDLEQILNYLIRGATDLKIVSISGMAGQGKTTLGKRIYNDPSIQYHFHKTVWCYVSKECNLKALVVNVARDAGCNVDDNSVMQDIIESLWRSLKGKRYLIVLDDIWDVDMWHRVQSWFPNDKNGSRILFTTRNHDLASLAEPGSISHPLQFFSPEESWELINAKFSKCGGIPEEFVAIGKKIAADCNGLPLALSLVASLLSERMSLDEWEEIAGNLKLHFGGEGCMHVIELSFKYLPDDIKPCFLYIAAFPRGRNIRAKKLKLLWAAEEFVKENDTHSTEDIAEKYLDYLVSRSLVVVTKRSSRGGIKTCNVHDLLYDLCIEKGRQDNFIHLADESIVSDTHGYNDLMFHHRLSIYQDGPVTLPKSTCFRKLNLPTSQIHTLLIYSFLPETRSLSYSLSSFSLLTVLDVEGFRLDMPPQVVFNNIHLRYLAFFGTISLSSILGLWSLETFIVICKMDGDQWIPDNLWKMKTLKYVDIDGGCLRQAEESSEEAASCNIEVLCGVSLNYDSKTTEFLRRLVRLRKLRCYCSDDDPMWFSMFEPLENLESLSVCFWSISIFRNPNLPLALIFPSNLRKLTLRSQSLPWSAMSTVGKLPSLEVLKLTANWDACAGTIWYLGDGEFSKLKYLKLYKMEIEQIDDSNCEDTPFPCLEKLLLIRCKSLEEIPFSFGNIYTLDTIDVTDSPKVSDSVRRIVEQQQEMGDCNLKVFGLDNENDEGCSS